MEMTIRECYESLGEDFENVLGRLMRDDMVKRFLLKFEKGVEFQSLEDALKEERYEDAFRYAHNMKGVGLNLGLSKFQKSSDNLCEALRGGEPSGDVGALFAEVKERYEDVLEAIKQLD